MTKRGNGTLTHSLTRLVQVITFILLFYCLQVGLSTLVGLILLLIQFIQPSGII